MRTVVLAAICALFASQAAAQASASATATGSVTVLDAAQIAPSAVLTVDPVSRPASGSRTAQANEASYTIVGQGGETFSVVVPPSLRLTRSGGTEEIHLQLTPKGASGTFDGGEGQSSTATVGVAGAAPVTSATATGVYTGELPVTLTFQ